MPRVLRRSFTLIEALVVVAIIAALMAIALPAVQAAREAGRRTACANNLRQLAIAVSLHEQAQQFFPTGGWGPEWVGDPDKAFGPEQPGGWIYNVLPYIEQTSLRQLGKGLTGAGRLAAIGQLLGSPIEILNCPTRRPALAYHYGGPVNLKNATAPALVAKGDYAINGEVSYAESEVTTTELQLQRGLSKLLLLGEKSLSRQHYEDGSGAGDTLSMYVGDCDDIRRSASGSPASDDEPAGGFGSAHSSGCNIAMADGAVRFVLFTDLLQSVGAK